MSELFDKQVNVQKGSLKKTSKVHVSSTKTKCVMKMKGGSAEPKKSLIKDVLNYLNDIQ